MSVTLDPLVQQLIRDLVDSGRYPDADAVVNDALQMLEVRDHHLAELRAKIQVGIDQADRGELFLLTPELMDQIDREADEMLARGEEPDLDVCP